MSRFQNRRRKPIKEIKAEKEKEKLQIGSIVTFTSSTLNLYRFLLVGFVDRPYNYGDGQRLLKCGIVLTRYGAEVVRLSDIKAINK